MRRVVASLAVMVVALVGLGATRPAAAEVQPSELAASDVVVEPAANVSTADRERLGQSARLLRSRGVPTKFVVVANRPVNPPRYAVELRQAIGFNGNVLVLSQSPNNLAIASSLPPQERQEAFERSVGDLRADPIGGTVLVAQRLSEAASGSGSGESSDGGGWGAAPITVPLILAGCVGVLALVRSQNRRRKEATLAERRAALEPMVDALAAHITDLGGDLRFGGDRVAEAQPHYDEAVLAYGEVRDGLPTARTAPAVYMLGRNLEKGLREAVSARAILDGRPVPPPEQTALLEGLCAFDPKHGRAVGDMPVVTPSGDEAQLPVCATCAEGLEQGRMPDVRRVHQRGRSVPYWQGAGDVGFGGGGLFPMFGGFLGGMVLHDLFTPEVIVHDQGDWGDGGWGDGYGDFGGGGDFGGDFGGGDFGGGGDF